MTRRDDKERATGQDTPSARTEWCWWQLTRKTLMAFEYRISDEARRTAAQCRHYAMCKIDYLAAGSPSWLPNSPEAPQWFVT